MRFLLLALAALVLVAPALASERHPTLGELEGQLMCPICAGETLAQSDAPAAQRIKAYIQGRIAAGDTRSEIKRKLVGMWGKRILAAPPRHGFDLLAWALPLVGLLGGAGILGLLAWRWTRVREPEPAPQRWSLNGHPLDPDEERRLDEELARFDR
ncbi:MAG TPA: cytochrome c-type biogenesis protein CcmH [Gaiellaceae bacterium]|nr:cytochrome c-type biogenesis protein CcmH [Gaiellaceae bacterium]